MNETSQAISMQDVQGTLKNKTILISAGGTGGHVYPALAVANQLKELGATVHWLGTEKGIEYRLVPEAHIPLHTIFVQGLRGNGIKRLLKAPFTVLSAVRQAKKVFKSVQPDLFVGFGGFASGPGAVAAKLSGVPVVIHEQNAAMGMTNKIVSLWAKKIMLAFPINNFKLQQCVAKKMSVVGNPVRKEIVEIANNKTANNSGNDNIRLLVMGGSLGAKAINEVVPQAIAPFLDNITVTHQTGTTTFADTVAEYERLGIADRVNIVEYIDDIAKVYQNTDLIIARAGALSVSEIASANIPAIFVPLPFAVDNHQYLNAQFLQKAGGAEIIEQKDLNVEKLQATITKHLDKELLADKSANLQALSHKDALADMVRIIEEII